MFDNSDLYDQTQALAGAIFQALGAVMAQEETPAETPPAIMQLRRGRAESPAWFMVQALEFDPEPISVTRLRVRDIYASERIVFALLELLASEKLLEPVAGDGERSYVLSDEGRRRISGRMQRNQERLGTLAHNSAPAVIALDKVLSQIIANSLAAGDPPGNWCLRYSRNRAPGDKAAPLARLLQYTADFNAYRDDAHMAAWQPLEVSGYAWEAFSFVQSGQADSAGEIDRQLHYRGYSQAEYEAALQELAGQGWLATSSTAPVHYQVTPAGQAAWLEVEQATNRYFYAPWLALEKDDRLHIPELITEVRQLLIGGGT